jgi:hypothetical protein
MGWLILFGLLLLGWGAGWLVKKVLRWQEEIRKQILFHKSQLMEREDLCRLADQRAEELLEREQELREEAKENLRDLDLLGLRLFYPEALRDVMEASVQDLEEVKLAKTIIARQTKHQRELRRVAEEAALMKAKQLYLKELEELRPQRRRVRDEEFSRDLARGD